jgi:hypothetical protein
MLPAMRRLWPRGPGNCGVCVDAAGAMLGPDCPLVRRTAAGFCSLGLAEAWAFQAVALPPGHAEDWLFEQSRRIADALSRGEVALAQIYGLYIPVGELDAAALHRLATAARLLKANFDPDEPRIPKGEPGAGQWTYEEGYAQPPAPGANAPGAASSGGGAGPEPPAGAGGEEPPAIPPEPPATPQERNSFGRRAAEWLKRALAAGEKAGPPQARAFLRILRTTWWLGENLPRILSYLDEPKTLEELQNAVSNPRLGYQRHHIVEGQYRSGDLLVNSKRFPDRLETRENLVRIPYWKHVEISAWYSTPNRQEYGGLTPREFLRGKDWNEQYQLGIQKLKDFGVLK